jgi:2-amino-4-hydroxy-6-hydroxymethyldihydropteridine diphosphokinase
MKGSNDRCHVGYKRLIFVGIGANLPGPDGTDALTTCCRAAAALDRLPGLQLRALSRWFTTAPVPDTGQPYYINGMAALLGSSMPDALLASLQAIEAAHGRVRTVTDAPRTLDLDIIAMGALVRVGPDPVIPHPRMHLRAFVLRPLADLAPDWVHPANGRTLNCLLDGVQGQTAVALAKNPIFS